MKNLNNLTLQSKGISSNSLLDIKGGIRFTTKSYSKFCAKRDAVQSSGAKTTNITHTGGVYCIDWFY